MADGEKRKGGRPKGSLSIETMDKIEAGKQFRARITQEFGPLIEAQIASAKGVSHLMAKDRAGKWQQVTDPKVMADCLNSGETFYKRYFAEGDSTILEHDDVALLRTAASALRAVRAEPRAQTPETP